MKVKASANAANMAGSVEASHPPPELLEGVGLGFGVGSGFGAGSGDTPASDVKTLTHALRGLPIIVVPSIQSDKDGEASERAK